MKLTTSQHILTQNLRNKGTTQDAKAFMSILCLFMFMYLSILAKAWSFLDDFLHSLLK